MGRDLGVASRLRAKGLSIIETDGWQWRGLDTLDAWVSLNHWDAIGGPGNATGLGVVINGRPSDGLPGPLYNTYQARDNTIYVIASGKSNNAGLGGFAGYTGNSKTMGHCVANAGPSEPLRPDQIVTMAIVNAAWCEAQPDPAGSVARVAQHFQWTDRKIDLRHHLNPVDFEALVMSHLGVGVPAPPPPPPASGVLAQIGSRGQFVSNIQTVCNAGGCPAGTVDGIFGPKTEAGVKCWQGKLGVPQTGAWDQTTQDATQRLFDYLAAVAAQQPQRPILKLDSPWMRGDDVEYAQRRLHHHGWGGTGVSNFDGIFGPNMDRRVKGFQVEKGLVPDGDIGSNTWAALG